MQVVQLKYRENFFLRVIRIHVCCIPGPFECSSSYHRSEKCPGVNKCVLYYQFCNGVDDCGDGSDEDIELCGTLK
jgi:hypothetical protein